MAPRVGLELFRQVGIIVYHLALFGIAQIGKAFRNEITPGNFIFRTREFEQMEMQFFVKPDEDEKWFEYWRHERMKFYEALGINMSKLRWLFS